MKRKENKVKKDKVEDQSTSLKDVIDTQVSQEPIVIIQTSPTVIEEAEDLDPVLRWQKIGGNFILNGKTIKSGEIFKARPSQIKPAFLDTIACLDVEKLQELRNKEKEVFITSPFVIKEVTKGKFDVVNIKNNKKINATPLTKEESEELKKALMA